MNHTASDFTVASDEHVEQEKKRVEEHASLRGLIRTVQDGMREGLRGFVGRPLTEEQKGRLLAHVREVLRTYELTFPSDLSGRFDVKIEGETLTVYDTRMNVREPEER
ncbi:MAG TPA: hypothetical protein PL072_05415 [Phycisphaerales bacterium]|nr:hypothetical protein [Phycisphaerales bacterium]